MARPHLPPAPFCNRPWQAVTQDDLRPAAGVPTMLHPDEQRLYYWLARHGIGGAGAVVDVGSFVGGSTARLGQGLKDAGSEAGLHAYDRFTADPGVKARYLEGPGMPRFEGRDILPLAQALLAPWRPLLHPGEIMEAAWQGGPIALLMLDACKTPALTDHIAQTFYPALVAGQSIVNHQDFLEWSQFWLPCHMLLLEDFFQPLAAPGGGSLLFRCIRVPGLADLRARRVSGLDDARLAEAIAVTLRRYRGWGMGRSLRRALAAIACNPGERLPWRMHPPRLKGAGPVMPG